MRILATISLLLGSYLAGASGSCYVSGCWSCWPDAYTCDYCDPYHWLYNGECYKCGTSTAWCDVCPNSGRPCYKCEFGFYLTSNDLCNLCNQSIPNCKYCSPDGEYCYICDDYSWAYGGVCTNNTPCAVGEFREPVTTLCTDCAHSIAYCSRCSDDGNKCFECDVGFFREKSSPKDKCTSCNLKFPNCTECNKNYCTKCTLGYHVNSYGQCQA